MEPQLVSKSKQVSPVNPNANFTKGKIQGSNINALNAAKGKIQPTLTINQPNDAYEQEADTVANEVMQMTSPVIQSKPLPISSLQRQSEHLEEKKLQEKGLPEGASAPGNDLESYVGNLSSGGQTMPNEVRSFFETRFNHDFSDVKIHTDSKGAQSAQSINALAYTSGNHIVFNHGQYSPETESGKRLLAHELTHVVQQRAAVQAKRTNMDNGKEELQRSLLGADIDDKKLLAISADAGVNASLFRKEISAFRKANTRGDILAKQAILQKADFGKVNLKDNSKTLRRCGGGTSAPAPVVPISFSSGSFNPGTGGTIAVTLSGASVVIDSPAYSHTGSVNVAGGTDAEATGWEAGFIQTLHSTNRKAHYIGSPAESLQSTSATTPARDALEASGEPWYDPSNLNGNGRINFSKTDSKANVKLWDAPRTGAPWSTPDGKGKLDKTDGKDVFTSWMIARKVSSPNTIHFCNWVSWEFDCSVNFNYASKGAKTTKSINGKTKTTGSGAGKGSNTPTLTGTTPNNSATITWS